MLEDGFLGEVGYEMSSVPRTRQTEYKERELQSHSGFRRQQERRDLLAASASEHPFLCLLFILTKTQRDDGKITRIASLSTPVCVRLLLR